MARIYALIGNYAEAINSMKKSLEVHPSNAKLLFELGALYEKSEDNEMALTTYQTGLYWYTKEVETDQMKRVRAKVKQWENIRYR